MIDGTYFNPGVIQQLMELIDTVKAMDEAAKKAADTMADTMADLAEEIAEASRIIAQREACYPIRPPRYIGPKSKTTPRVQRVDRVARSSCRKIRR